jgi:hypothetical protein
MVIVPVTVSATYKFEQLDLGCRQQRTDKSPGNLLSLLRIVFNMCL